MVIKAIDPRLDKEWSILEFVLALGPHKDTIEFLFPSLREEFAFVYVQGG